MVKLRFSNKIVSGKLSQLGQGMTEYIIVLVTLIGVATTTPLLDELFNLKAAINHKNKGFAYAISLSDYPDAEELKDLSPEAAAQVAKLQETFDKIDKYASFEIPEGIDTSGMPDINLESIMELMF